MLPKENSLELKMQIDWSYSQKCLTIKQTLNYSMTGKRRVGRKTNTWDKIYTERIRTLPY